MMSDRPVPSHLFSPSLAQSMAPEASPPTFGLHLRHNYASCESHEQRPPVGSTFAFPLLLPPVDDEGCSGSRVT